MNIKEEIKGYSIDYRNNKNETEYKSYNKISKRVVASSPNTTKKEKIEIEKKTLPKSDVYVDTSSSLKTIMYKSLFGGLVLTLAIVGGFIFFKSIKQSDCTKTFNTISIDNYSDFIAPVVMHDPDPFDSPENANKSMVLSSSIWRAILQNGTQKYDSFDEKGFSLIPVSDIEKASKDLFGSDYKIDTSDRIFGPFYNYEPGEANFHISAISNENSFLPYVKNVKKEADKTILTVGYFLRNENTLNEKEEQNFIKIIKYILKQDEKTKEQYIYAVEEIK